MKYKIVEKGNHNHVHSIGYYGEYGKKKAQARIDSGEAVRFYSDKTLQFEVIEDNE